MGALVSWRGRGVADGKEPDGVAPRPEERLGAALRSARQERGLSLRALAKLLYRSHSNLVEYERGHRLPPVDVVESYEVHLGIPKGTLVGLREAAYFELHGEDPLQRQTHPLRAALPSPFQLPTDIADFTGRESELAQIRALVAEAGPLGGAVVISAIAGMAGVGKTALAVHLAHQLAPGFPDAQLFVNLRGYDVDQPLTPAEALDGFLRSLGVTNAGLPATLDRKASLYRSLLAGRRALVLLDNASSEEQVRPLLPGSPTCLVLVTSRSSLLGLVAAEGARRVHLDVLGPAEARELLARVAGQDGRYRVRREPEAGTEVARLCGRLPLAVRIAASELAARPHLSIAELARRLSDEQHRLRQLVTGDVSIRASFTLSYQNLEHPAARMFRWLGLIAVPGFGRGVAAALMDVAPEEAERLLETLVDAHLLEAGTTPGRYRFHDLLRLFARERAHAEESDADREAALDRMFHWYLATADTAGRLLIPGRRRLPYELTGRWHGRTFATRGEALAWFETERSNLVAATRQAADLDLHSLAWQLPDALWSFFFLRSYWADWRDTHQIGLAAAREAGNRQAEAWMMSALGDLDLEWLKFGEEVACTFRRSVALCREIGDREGEARALCGLGRCQILMRRFEGGIESEQQALTISREIGYPYRQGVALYHLGEAYCDMGRLDEAVDCHRQALSIRRKLGDQWNEGVSLTDLGRVYCDLRRFEDAIDCEDRSLAIAREIGHRSGEARALEILGVAIHHTQGVEAARGYWREALRIFAGLGAPQADEVRGLLTGERESP
jgi:tetratricopeptide (TPR) repeat protein/transcriptional regulator with XRE-family HTH domain